MSETHDNMDVEDVEDAPRKPKERGLGRGLGALFGDEEEVYPHYEEEIADAPQASRKIVGIEQLFPCPDQPRRHFDEKPLKELSASIIEHGVLMPILVRPDPTRAGMYEIIAGERRWRAAQKAQLHEVPIIIREMDDATMFQIALVENLQRQDLNAIEEAIGFQRLIDYFGHSPESAAEVLGKSRSHVANMIRLLDLPESVQNLVVSNQITAGHARALLRAEQPALLAQQVISENLSVRQTEKLAALSQGEVVQSRGKNGAKKGAGFAAKDADTLALEKEVSNKLGMNVTIDMAGASAGKMSIHFKNLDQLDDILQRLAQTPKY